VTSGRRFRFARELCERGIIAPGGGVVKVLSNCLLALACLAATAFGCGDEDDPSSDAGTDTDTDSDTDVDTDSSSDTDTDTDSGTDDIVEDFWEWNEIVFGNAGGEIFMDYGRMLAFLLNDHDDILGCYRDFEEDYLGEYDGSEGSMSILDLEGGCEHLFGIDSDNTWLLNDTHLYRRTGTGWLEETVEDADGCELEMLFGSTLESVTLVGKCGPLLDSRTTWQHTGVAWSSSDQIVPSVEEMSRILRVLDSEPRIFTGVGGVFAVDTEVSDLGFPGDGAKYVGGGPGDGLVCMSSTLFIHDEGSWEQVFDEMPECEFGCWADGAWIAPTDALLCGNPNEEFGWHIHHWDGAQLKLILEPCSGCCCDLNAAELRDGIFYAAGKNAAGEGVVLWQDTSEYL
jgi:hypothetical protein